MMVKSQILRKMVIWRMWNVIEQVPRLIFVLHSPHLSQHLTGCLHFFVPGLTFSQLVLYKQRRHTVHWTIDISFNYNKQPNFAFLSAVPRSPSRISPASAPRTPLQTAKATGVIYSVPDNISTPPPSQSRSSFRASPPKGIRGSPVCKNGKSASQDVSKGEQSPVEPTVDTLRPQTSASRLR